MRFDVAKGSHHLSHGRIHTCTHVHGLSRQPDFINADHVASALSNSAKADITEYIVLFYNQRRIQKSLDFKTPNQIAENFYRLAA